MLSLHGFNKESWKSNLSKKQVAIVDNLSVTVFRVKTTNSEISTN